MKKILIALILIICVFMFAGCSRMVTEDSYEYGYFTKITTYNIPGAWATLMYDPVTKVIYIETRAGYHSGFSVYYTMINGKPEVAIYGVNWIETNFMGAY